MKAMGLTEEHSQNQALWKAMIHTGDPIKKEIIKKALQEKRREFKENETFNNGFRFVLTPRLCGDFVFTRYLKVAFLS